MKTLICKYLSSVIPECSTEEFFHWMETPSNEKMGDYALPCFAMAKRMHKNPNVIACDMSVYLEEKKEALVLERIEVVGAYCNIYLKRSTYVEKTLKDIDSMNQGIQHIGFGKTICIDYSSPNIAKNFHVGHLRTTIIGNSLYKIYKKLGYDVVRINHLGDWGTQFGKLIVAYKLWSSKEQVEKDGIEELMRIYVKFNEESEKNEALIQHAREWFVKMEQDNEEALVIWNWFKEISMVHFERVYHMLDMEFDSYLGESFYRDKVPALVNELKRKNLLVESQGADIIDLGAYDIPPCLITKSDGSSIYHSRDIAAILYRKETYNFEKCLYVTGLEQSLHFKQIFKAIEVMGYDYVDGLIHVPYGLVRLSGEKLSTRNGNIIYAEDILNEAIQRAAALINEKNSELAKKEETAKIVGIGAVIFHDLFNQRMKDVDFSWKEVLSFEGTTGPYVQYTFARAKSILRKYGKDISFDGIDYNVLTDDLSYNLIKILSLYENSIVVAAEKQEPSIIARYVISLATAFNKFYHECSILSVEKSIKQARLIMVELVSSVIRDASDLLGIKCVFLLSKLVS